MSEDSEEYLDSGSDGEEEYLDSGREAMEAPTRRNSKGYRVYHESELEKMQVWVHPYVCLQQLLQQNLSQLSMPCLQDQVAQDVCSMWGCSQAAAKSLLIFYRWNKERLMSKWPASLPTAARQQHRQCAFARGLPQQPLRGTDLLHLPGF
jgi:hypothetical protein